MLPPSVVITPEGALPATVSCGGGVRAWIVLGLPLEKLEVFKSGYRVAVAAALVLADDLFVEQLLDEMRRL